MLDRDLRLYGLMGMGAALAANGREIGAFASGGSRKENADLVPRGRKVMDPVNREILAEFGRDPDQIWYPPIDARPGEYTLNDLVEFYRSSSVKGLRDWIPQGKGTDRGALEVELVNDFVDEFFLQVLEEGAELTYTLGPAEMLLHDVLNESTDYPNEGSYEEQIAWCNGQLEIYTREGGARE